MNSKNEINNDSQYKTEENKLKDNLNSSIRNRMLFHNKNKSNYNPIKALNNRSTFQIKPRNEMSSYKINNNILQKYYAERNANCIPFNIKKNKIIKNDYGNNNEEKDDLIIQLYHTSKDLNQINKEIKELKNLFSNEEKENMTHKYIINKILQENQKVKVIHNYDSPKNSKRINKSLPDEENKSKNSTVKIKSIKKGFFYKNYSLEKNKNRTIPNSLRKVKAPAEAKIDTLKKELYFYQKMIETKEEKLKKFNKKEGTIIYKDINLMIEQKNKNFKNLSKYNNEIINKLFESDEKIFELSQRLSKARDKTNNYLNVIENYKNKISEFDYKINILTKERTKRQKEEQEQEIKKSKEESELNSLINEKKILEEKYDKKLELKLEQNDYKRELENSYKEEKKYKLKNEVNEIKLKYCQKKNEELNQKVEEYEKERDSLLEKSKVPRKNKIKIEEMESEMELLIEEIETLDKQLENINKKIEEKNKNKINEEIKEEKEEKEEIISQ